eukprot:6187420-Pleurochrysis_carterae.AAC.1
MACDNTWTLRLLLAKLGRKPRFELLVLNSQSLPSQAQGIRSCSIKLQPHAVPREKAISSRPVGLALYGRLNRKSVGSPEAV